jgi:hypothetical protein
MVGDGECWGHGSVGVWECGSVGAWARGKQITHSVILFKQHPTNFKKWSYRHPHHASTQIDPYDGESEGVRPVFLWLLYTHKSTGLRSEI